MRCTVSDPEAFAEFCRQHIEAVTRFIARRVDDPAHGRGGGRHRRLHGEVGTVK
jgi:hypothetical protein